MNTFENVNLSTSHIYSQRIHLVVLGLLLVGLNVLIYIKFGIKVVTDSSRYIEWSHEPFTAVSPTNWKFYSLTYVSFLKLVLSLGLGLYGVVLGQMIISALACYCLYKLTIQISDSPISGFIAAFLYLAFGEIVQWNTYIMTESLFTSGIIFLMYALHNSRKIRHWVLTFLLLISVSLIRPMGITVLMASGIFLIYRFELLDRMSFKIKLLGFGLALGLGLIFFYFLLEGNPNVNFYYSRGQIVWGTNTEELRKNAWLIIDNKDIQYPSPGKPAYQMFLIFVRDNFAFFLELFTKKLTLFVTHVKPYYSPWHNVYIALFLGGVYLAGFRNIWIAKKTHTIARFALWLFVLNALMVGLSVEAWEGRFLIPVLSPLIAFSANDFGKLISRN